MSKPSKKKVIIFLDTDKHTSPFDILMAIDLFPDAQILQYSNVSAEDAKRIIQDSMFPRGPKGAKQTKIFIGGHSVDKAVEILSVAKKCMFPPFELSIMVDPRGAFTTASAAVAKTLVSLGEELDDLHGKTVTVLAGTGPVGQTAARLYARGTANVIVTSRSQERANSVATKINEETGSNLVRGIKANEPDEIGESIKDAEIVLAAGAAGIRLLPLDVLKKYGQKCKVVGDVNAIPPLGIEGLKPNDENVEIIPGILGVGGLIIGSFKNKIEGQLFKRTVESSKGIFDYKMAYDVAKLLISK